MLDGQNHSNDELEDKNYDDETFTQGEETASTDELETEQDDSDGDDTVTLSRAEFEQRLKEARRDQDKRWKERIDGLNSKGDRKESGQKAGIEEGVASKEDIDRFRLETKGIEDKASQDFILKYAKLEGLSVAEALKDDVVQAKLSKLSADQERSRATQSPINRTGRPREKTPEELARMVEKGQLPSSKEERKAALKALQQKYGRTS